jgi:hypothetical protein
MSKFLITVYERTYFCCEECVTAFCVLASSPRAAWLFARSLFPNERTHITQVTRMWWLDKTV